MQMLGSGSHTINSKTHELKTMQNISPELSRYLFENMLPKNDPTNSNDRLNTFAVFLVN